MDDDGLRPIGVPLSSAEYLRRLWAHRHFVWAVPLGQLRAQTQNSVVGGLWHLLNPLISAALYYAVFGVLFGGRAQMPDYGAFLVVGIFVFVFTSRTVAGNSRAITAQMGLLSQISFPRLALPAAATLAEALSHGLAMLALFLILPFLGVPPAWTWLAICPIFVLQGAFNLGVGMVVARLGHQFRDLQNLLPHVMRIWMYSSGVFFSVDFLRDALGGNSIWVWLFQLNPAYAYISLTRAAVLESASVSMLHVATAFLWAVISVVFGFQFFRAREVEYGRL